jgi:hypothetical protein
MLTGALASPLLSLSVAAFDLAAGLATVFFFFAEGSAAFRFLLALPLSLPSITVVTFPSPGSAAPVFSASASRSYGGTE